MASNPNAMIQSLESRRLLADVVALGAQSTLADMNGDGKADLVGITRNPTAVGVGVFVSIALGRGNGTFAPSDRIFINANTGFGLGVGDLDGDGSLDVAVAGDNPLSMAPITGTFVLTALGNGDGKFKRTAGGTSNTDGNPLLVTTFVPQIARAMSVSIADLDHNGFGEVSVLGANRSTSSGTSLNPAIVVNWDPTLPTFAPVPPTVIAFNSLVIINQLNTADLDGDGRLDLVATNRTPMPPSLLAVVRSDLVIARFPVDHTAVVRQGINLLNALPPTPTPSAAPIETFGLADLNNDGVSELVGRTRSVLRYSSYNGANTLFGPVHVIAAANTPPDVLMNPLLGDVTGDGLSDVLALSRRGPVVAVNVTQASGAVAVRWSRVPIGGAALSIVGEDDQVLSEILS